VSARLGAALRAPRLHIILRLLLGLVFVYASLDKIAHPSAFARIVYQWQILGPVPANVVAVTLPWVELVAGVLLLFGVWRRDAAMVLAVLLVVFLGAAVSVLSRGIDVENCGCTSVAAASAAGSWPPAWMRGVGWFLIARNALLLGAALVLGLVEPRRAAPTAVPVRGTDP
jgi:cobalt-zinc-cadmium efflux system protein